VDAFSHLNRCLDITREELIAATASREACSSFLDHVARIAKPREGAPLVLFLFSRMATTACEWLEGGLRIDLIAKGEHTIVDVQVYLGEGFAERVFPRHTLAVPLDELEQSIQRFPKMIWPLAVEVGSRHVRLSASREVRSSTVPPSISFMRKTPIPKAPRVPAPSASLPVPAITAAPRLARRASSRAPGRTKRTTIPYGG